MSHWCKIKCSFSIDRCRKKFRCCLFQEILVGIEIGWLAEDWMWMNLRGAGMSYKGPPNFKNVQFNRGLKYQQDKIMHLSLSWDLSLWRTFSFAGKKYLHFWAAPSFKINETGNQKPGAICIFSLLLPIHGGGRSDLI